MQTHTCAGSLHIAELCKGGCYSRTCSSTAWSGPGCKKHGPFRAACLRYDERGSVASTGDAAQHGNVRVGTDHRGDHWGQQLALFSWRVRTGPSSTLKGRAFVMQSLREAR